MENKILFSKKKNKKKYKFYARLHCVCNIVIAVVIVVAVVVYWKNYTLANVKNSKWVCGRLKKKKKKN